MHPSIRRRLAATAAVLAAAVGASLATVAPATAVNGVPRFDHVVQVVFENHSASSIYGSSQAPYLNSLANTGAKFTQSFAIEHPSEPNYLDLFSGSNQGVTDDSCPHTFSTANQAAELIGPLGDERPVDRGEHRRRPVEPLRRGSTRSQPPASAPASPAADSMLAPLAGSSSGCRSAVCATNLKSAAIAAPTSARCRGGWYELCAMPGP